MEECDLLVAGAGPAGVAAAAEASRHGLRVIVVDPRPHAGGQYYARLPVADPFVGLPRLLTAGLDPARVSFWSQSEVWGVFGDRLAVTTPEGSRLVTPAGVVVATGAVERPQPFPGWDHPSVMSAGAAQLLLKEQAVVPHGRVVVAGSGPFLVAVAGQLSRAGAHVALVEATPWRVLAQRLLPLLASRTYGPDGLRLAARLSGVRRIFGVQVVRKQGDQVVLSDGRQLGCDLLCVGYGFSPRLSLAQLLDCRTDGSGIVVDDDQRTSRPAVFAAGEVTGIGGALLATVEGRLAGLAAAADHRGGLPLDERRRRERLQQRRARLRRSAARLLGAYVQLAPLALATDETVICRCEAVTLGAVRGARLGAPPAEGTRALKALLRCGMGPCLGVFCKESLTAALGGPTMADYGTDVRPRPPIAAVTLAEIARLDDTL